MHAERLSQQYDEAIDAAISSINILEYEFEDDKGNELLAFAPEETTILVAANTGAVDHIIPVGALPCGCVPDGIVGRHFVSANDGHIEAYGGCDTLMTTREGQIACKYQVADIARTLHSISRTTGPIEGPGTYDILFNNKLGVVMLAGIVNKISEKIKPIMQYHRRGRAVLR